MSSVMALSAPRRVSRSLRRRVRRSCGSGMRSMTSPPGSIRSRRSPIGSLRARRRCSSRWMRLRRWLSRPRHRRSRSRPPRSRCPLRRIWLRPLRSRRRRRPRRSRPLRRRCPPPPRRCPLPLSRSRHRLRRCLTTRSCWPSSSPSSGSPNANSRPPSPQADAPTRAFSETAAEGALASGPVPPLPLSVSGAPDLGGDLDDQLELGLLLVDREVVALLGGGEAALPRDPELVDVDVARGLLDPALEQVLVLELGLLGGDEPEDHPLVALGQEAQRLERAGALVVELQEVAVDAELAEQRLGDEVVAALGSPHRLVVAAAQ